MVNYPKLSITLNPISPSKGWREGSERTHAKKRTNIDSPVVPIISPRYTNEAKFSPLIVQRKAPLLSEPSPISPEYPYSNKIKLVSAVSHEGVYVEGKGQGEVAPTYKYSGKEGRRGVMGLDSRSTGDLKGRCLGSKGGDGGGHSFFTEESAAPLKYYDVHGGLPSVRTSRVSKPTIIKPSRITKQPTKAYRDSRNGSRAEIICNQTNEIVPIDMNDPPESKHNIAVISGLNQHLRIRLKESTPSDWLGSLDDLEEYIRKLESVTLNHEPLANVIIDRFRSILKQHQEHSEQLEESFVYADRHKKEIEEVHDQLTRSHTEIDDLEHRNAILQSELDKMNDMWSRNNEGSIEGEAPTVCQSFHSTQGISVSRNLDVLERSGRSLSASPKYAQSTGHYSDDSSLSVGEGTTPPTLVSAMRVTSYLVKGRGGEVAEVGYDGRTLTNASTQCGDYKDVTQVHIGVQCDIFKSSLVDSMVQCNLVANLDNTIDTLVEGDVSISVVDKETQWSDIAVNEEACYDPWPIDPSVEEGLRNLPWYKGGGRDRDQRKSAELFELYTPVDRDNGGTSDNDGEVGGTTVEGYTEGLRRLTGNSSLSKISKSPVTSAVISTLASTDSSTITDGGELMKLMDEFNTIRDKLGLVSGCISLLGEESQRPNQDLLRKLSRISVNVEMRFRKIHSIYKESYADLHDGDGDHILNREEEPKLSLQPMHSHVLTQPSSCKSPGGYSNKKEKDNLQESNMEEMDQLLWDIVSPYPRMDISSVSAKDWDISIGDFVCPRCNRNLSSPVSGGSECHEKEQGNRLTWNTRGVIEPSTPTNRNDTSDNVLHPCLVKTESFLPVTPPLSVLTFCQKEDVMDNLDLFIDRYQTIVKGEGVVGADDISALARVYHDDDAVSDPVLRENTLQRMIGGDFDLDWNSRPSTEEDLCTNTKGFTALVNVNSYLMPILWKFVLMVLLIILLLVVDLSFNTNMCVTALIMMEYILYKNPVIEHMRRFSLFLLKSCDIIARK